MLVLAKYHTGTKVLLLLVLFGSTTDLMVPELRHMILANWRHVPITSIFSAARIALMSAIQNKAAAAWVCLAVSSAAVLSGYPFTPEAVAPLVREHGWIEASTNAAYGLSIIVLLAVHRHDRRFFLHTAFVVALMGARELDFHKAFTTDGVSKLTFFTGDHVGRTEKVVVGLVLSVLVVIALRYLKYWRRLRDGIAHRSPAAYSVSLLIVVIPATKMLDSMLSGVQILKLVEESLELTLPVITLVAVAQYLLSRRT
jgi:hypothetical protein